LRQFCIDYRHAATFISGSLQSGSTQRRDGILAKYKEDYLRLTESEVPDRKDASHVTKQEHKGNNFIIRRRNKGNNAR
jgi:hypothetical protein